MAAVFAGLASMSLFLGCSKTPTERSPQRSNESVHDRINTIVEMPIRSLDPTLARDAVTQKLHNLVFGSLVERDERLRPMPGLASHWKTVSSSEICFYLKPSLRFADGSALAVADVIESFSKYQTAKGYSGALARISKVVKKNENELCFQSKKGASMAFFIEDLSVVKIFKTIDQKIIESGRYRVVKWSDSRVILSRNPNFHERSDSYDQRDLDFHYVPDEATRFQLFLKGEFDVAINPLGPSKSVRLAEVRPELSNQLYDGVNFLYLGLNFENPILKNNLVRQAIAHAIDRREMASTVYKNRVVLADGILSPSVTGFFVPDLKRFDYSRTRAEDLLDKAGYQRGASKNRFTLRFVTSPDRYSLQLCRLIAIQLEAVGIGVDLRVYEGGALVQKLREGAFDIFQSRWVGVSNPSIFARALSDKPSDLSNYGRYRNRSIQEKISKAMATNSEVERKKIFSDVQKAIAEDLPYISMFHWKNDLFSISELKVKRLFLNGDYLSFAYIERLKGAAK